MILSALFDCVIMLRYYHANSGMAGGIKKQQSAILTIARLNGAANWSAAKDG
jgi:hypothetical protein